MKLSVLIGTRNRAKSLDATLQSFFAQHLSGEHEYELIVIDNDSTDETKQVATRWEVEQPTIVRYGFELVRGHTHARNNAIAIATGDVIVFTDDDVLFDKEWLNEIHREFSSDKTLFALGGRVLLANKDLQEVSFQPSDERQVFVYPHSGTFVMGANMAFRREVFERIGMFDVRLGVGTFFAAADDADIFYRALKAGYNVLYAPNVLVYHNHDRKSVEQACRLEYGYGKSCPAYLIKHALKGDVYAMKMVYWLLYKLPRRWLRIDGEPDDLLKRRRSQIRGIIIGLIASPLLLLRRSAEP